MKPRDWIRSRAKQMRKEMTPHENAMWGVLHEGELIALNWRRQVAFGDYILDFVSHPARLVIEVDGSQHAEAGQAARDEARSVVTNGPPEAFPQSVLASPPQSVARATDSSSIEEERR